MPKEAILVDDCRHLRGSHPVGMQATTGQSHCRSTGAVPFFDFLKLSKT